MKSVFVMLLLLMSVSAFGQAESTVVEIEIQGMTCALCADGGWHGQRYGTDAHRHPRHIFTLAPAFNRSRT